MGLNNRFNKQSLLTRCRNAVVKMLAMLGALFIMRTYYDGGDVFFKIKLYTFDFIVELITTITKGS